MEQSTDRKHVFILGVRIISATRSEVLRQVKRHLDTKQRFILFTPNPEILLEANRDQKLRKILNNSAVLAVADGVGLRPWVPVTPGRQLLWDLLSMAEQEKLKVFFLGGRPNTITRTLVKMRVEYPGLIAKGDSAAMLDRQANPIDSSEEKKQEKALRKIRQFKPDLLFVALGAPKQEYWISTHFDKLPVKMAMAIGGSLDYFSGVKPLPPQIMANFGLEWLWRVLHERGHWRRAFRAVVVFPLIACFDIIGSKLREIGS